MSVQSLFSSALFLVDWLFSFCICSPAVWNVGGEDLGLECVGDGRLGLDFGGV